MTLETSWHLHPSRLTHASHGITSTCARSRVSAHRFTINRLANVRCFYRHWTWLNGGLCGETADRLCINTTYPPSRRTVRRSVMFNVCKNVIVRKHYPNLINEFHIYLPCTTRWVAQVMFSRRLYMLYCVNMLLCLYVYYGVRMAVSKIKAKRLKWSSSKSRPYDI